MRSLKISITTAVYNKAKSTINLINNKQTKIANYYGNY